ncbi:MAG: transglycosylase SLT domain-containing protein [Oryzihumus sp.]
MRLAPAALDAAWRSGDFTGPRRPVVRVTIQHAVKRKQQTPKGRWSTLQFDQASPPRELNNVRSCTWDRSDDLEIATCQLSLWNCQPVKIGATPGEAWQSEPGFYSPRNPNIFNGRQVSVLAGPAPTNETGTSLSHGGAGVIVTGTGRALSDIIIRADMVVRTYEGYGCDPTKTPDQDPNLMQTGVWMIDKVTFDAGGIISVSMRDIGRQLVDEICFPPVVPLTEYPLSFTSYQHHPATQSAVHVVMGFHDDASGGKTQLGHKPKDALDGNDGTFWLSKPYAHKTDYTWYTVSCPHVTLNGLEFRPWHGNYGMYICIQVNGRWQGNRKFHGIPFVQALTVKGEDHPIQIPFHKAFHNVTAVRIYLTNLVDIGSKTQTTTHPTGSAVVQAIAKAAKEQGVPLSWAIAIAYHESGLNPQAKGDYVNGSPTSFGLYQLHEGGELGSLTPQQAFDPYTNARVALTVVGQVKRANPGLSAGEVAVLAQRPALSVRPAYITFVNNYVSTNHPDVVATAEVHTPPDYRAGIRHLYGYKIVTHPPYITGNYGDYTDIVKKFVAMGGFHWPAGASRYVGSSPSTYGPTSNDPVIASGRAWGDFMQSGTSGPVPISSTEFDKKPLLDGVTYVRDILGFYFAIGEDGAVIWRLPNWWKIGCWGPNGYMPGFVHHLDETTVLRDLSVTEDTSDQRSRVFVANPNNHTGAVVAGFDDNIAGLERVAVYEDTHFADQTQCRVTADLIALRSFFNLNTDSLKISGNPAIQVDDQARIVETVTRQNYLHHIKGIKSTLDMEKGEYTMELTTAWLGNNPNGAWAFDPRRLLPETKTWLAQHGVLA